MSALIHALDNHTPTQLGENGHAEYGWSNNIQEKIVQFHFQLTRTHNMTPLKSILTSLLETLSSQVNSGSGTSNGILARDYLSILYRMIGQTRDIIDGKGEYALTYMMIYTWYSFYPKLAMFALRCLVDMGEDHPYGSWKDIKKFCEYCKQNGADVSHPLIQYAVQITNAQLKKDEKTMSENNAISLVSKWVPREKTDYGWLYNELATQYYKYTDTALTEQAKQKALLKCKTHYRKLVSSLNRYIDTVQIKQCGKQWASIDFEKVTSITIHKNTRAFLNKTKRGTVRYSDDDDRIACAEHFNAHIQKAVSGEKEIKGKRIGMADFTKRALECCNQAEIDVLNSQWRDNASQTGALGKMIAMVDVSGSMKGDPMDVAIALGIRIAEKSVLGKRVMTFSAIPTWVNLEPYPDFVSQVNVVKRADWGTNTNFRAALDMILEAIVKNKMAPEEVEDMVLVILSDMQMDTGDKSNKKTLYRYMETAYAEAGMKAHGRPYHPPHILFWNLRGTSGFPTLSSQPNTSMMSGFSPSLLNMFCEKGMSSLQSYTPLSLLQEALEKERYQLMGNALLQEISV